MAETHFTGPVQSTAGFIINNDPGVANSWSDFTKLVTGITSGAATTVLTVTFPNQNCSGVLRILICSGITAASHIYDSTRVVEYLVALTRVAGANAVAGVSAAVGAQIATSSGGQTLTSTLAAASVAGGVTAVNTIALQITNTVSGGGTSQTLVLCELLNAAGATLSQGSALYPAATPQGITVA